MFFVRLFNCHQECSSVIFLSDMYNCEYNCRGRWLLHACMVWRMVAEKGHGANLVSRAEMGMARISREMNAG